MNWITYEQYLLIAILAATIFLGFFVYLRNRAALLNKAFVLFSFNTAVWTFVVLMILISRDKKSFLLWARLTFAINVFIPPNFLLFTTVLSLKRLPSPRKFPLLYAVYAVAVGLSLFSFTDLIIRGCLIDEMGRISPVYGPTLPLFLAYFTISMGGIFYYLSKKIRVHTGLKRLQFQYVFFGMMTYAGLAIVTGVIAPLLGITTTELACLSPAFGLIWLSLIAYAIVKHQLMDIFIIIKRTTLYVLLTMSITGGYITIVMLSQWLFGELIGFQSLLPAMVAALLIAFAFVPLKGAIQRFVDKTMFKRNYDHHRILQDLSRILTSIYSLDELLNLIIGIIAEAMGIKRAFIYLRQSDDGTYGPKAAREEVEADKTNRSVKSNEPLIGKLFESRNIIIREQLERLPLSIENQAIIDRFGELGVEIAIPIFSKENLSGFLLLGAKDSGETFTREDVEMFTTLSHHIAVAIENAQLYSKVEESKIYQEILLNNLTSGVIAVDLKARITTINKKAEEILNIRADQAVGKDIEIIAPGLREALWMALQKGELLSNKEVGVRLKGKKDVPLAVSTSIFKNYEGRPMGALIVFSDLTQRKILEAEMQRADRLASLGKLAAGLAHEIKNPLVSLKTFTQLLPEKYKRKEFREDFSKLAGKEVDRINHLVEQLLNLSRPVSLVSLPVDLSEVLKDTLSLLKSRIYEDKAILKEDIREGPLHIIADREQLNQVFINLIINALESMKEGGTLSVRTGTREPPASPDIPPGSAEEEHDKLNDQACAVVVISDTGRGIKPEDLPHLFDPFFTTKKTGAGLGLSIVHNIVKEHGGIIKVKSVPREGTTFTIIFPLFTEEAE